MASIPVLNPPRRRKKTRRPRRVKRTKVLTISAAKRTNVRRRKRRHKLAAVHHVKRRVARKRRSHRRKSKRSSTRFVNPFGSTMAVMGNPFKSRSGRKRRNKSMARHHRKRRRHSIALRNPFSPSAILAGPKEMVSKEFIVDAASAAAGFVLPGLAMNYIPVTFRNTTIKFYAAKVATVAVLSAAGSMVSKRASRMILLGGTISILLDVWTQFKAQGGASPAPAKGTDAYYGEGIDAYYGPGINDGGVFLADDNDAGM